MSKRGPKKLNHRLKSKASAKPQIVNLQEILTNPTLFTHSLSSPFMGLLDEAAPINKLTKEFIDIAKTHATAQRQRDATGFFAVHRDALTGGSLNNFIRCIDMHFAENDIPYEHMHNVLQGLEEQVKILKDDPSKATEYQSLIAKLAQKRVESLQLLLIGCEKLNVWYTLLTQYPNIARQVSNYHENIRTRLFLELHKVTGHLVSRLISSELQTDHYYQVYEILDEKWQWLAELGPAHQEDLLKKLNQVREGTLPFPEVLFVNIDNLLKSYQNAVLFHFAFGSKHKAETLQHIAETFSEMLQPFVTETSEPLTLERISKFKSNLLNMQSLQPDIEKHRWLIIFKTLDQFLHKTDSAPVTTPSLINIIQEAKILQSLMRSEVDLLLPEVAHEWLNRLLKLVQDFRHIHEDEKSSADYQAISFLAIILQSNIKKSEMLSGYIGMCLQSALTKLTEQLVQDTKNAVDIRPKAPSSSSSSSSSSSPVTRHEPIISSMAVIETASIIESEEPIQDDLNTSMEKLSLAVPTTDEQPDHAFTLQEHATQAALHQEQLKAIQQEQETARTQLAKDSAEERQQTLAKQREAQSKELAELTQKYLATQKKYSEKKKGQLTHKQQQLKQAHQKQLQQIENVHTAKIAEIRQHHTCELQKLEEQRKIQSNELTELTQKHLLAQSQFSKRNQSQLAQKQMQLKQAHQLQLEQIENAHSAKMTDIRQQHSCELQKIAEQQLKFEDELKALAAHYAAELAARTSELEATRTQMQQQNLSCYQAACSALKTQHHTEFTALTKRYQRATDEQPPIGIIPIPVEYAYLLQDLEEANIEAYVCGGYVRNRLLGIASTLLEDFDIIVNCLPEELPAKIKRFAQVNPLQPCQYKMGKIDFWCKPWDNLKDELQNRDLTINTFIAKFNGEVFDLLGYLSHLQAPNLHLLGDLINRFKDDPSLILRMLRFSTQLHKGIHAEDFQILRECAPLIKKLPIGIYLKNIEQLFIGMQGIVNFQHLMQADLLPAVFPGILLVGVQPQRPALWAFWAKKLHEFALNSKQVSYYHILALMMLQPLLHQPSSSIKSDVRRELKACIKNYFDLYQGTLSLPEKAKIKQTILAITLSHTPVEGPSIPGLHEQFLQFERLWLAQQQAIYTAQQSVVYTPLRLATQQPLTPAPASQEQLSVTSNRPL